MTRLPTLLTSIVVLAVCIGLNVHRYPVVWESMRAAAPSLNVTIPREPTSQEVTTAASEITSQTTENTSNRSETSHDSASDAPQNDTLDDNISESQPSKVVAPTAVSDFGFSTLNSDESDVAKPPSNVPIENDTPSESASTPSTQEVKTDEIKPDPTTPKEDTQTSLEDQNEDVAENTVAQPNGINNITDNNPVDVEMATMAPQEVTEVTADKPVELADLEEIVGVSNLADVRKPEGIGTGGGTGGEGVVAATAAHAEGYEKREVVLTSQRRSLVSRPGTTAGAGTASGSTATQGGWTARERPFSREEIRAWLRKGR